MTEDFLFCTQIKRNEQENFSWLISIKIYNYFKAEVYKREEFLKLKCELEKGKFFWWWG